MAAQDLCTLSDVKAALETTSSARDTIIGSYITRASEAIMADVDREFAPVTASATRRFRVDSFLLSLAPYDLRTVSAFVLNPESTSPQTLAAQTDYELLPIGAPSGTYTSVSLSRLLTGLYSSSTVFTHQHALCDITGAWGFAAVPEDVKQAAVLTVSTWLRRDVTAIALQSDTMVNEAGLAPSLPSSFSIPGDAKRLLSPYRRLSTMVAI